MQFGTVAVNIGIGLALLRLFHHAARVVRARRVGDEGEAAYRIGEVQVSLLALLCLLEIRA